MTRKLLVAAVAALLLVPRAAPAAELKVGVIDMQRALNETEEGKRALDRLKSKLESENAAIKARQDELKKLDDELNKQGYMLSEAARAEKELKFRRLREDFEKYRQEKGDEFMRQQKEATEGILKKLLVVLDDFAKKEGLSVIMESSSRTQGMPGSVIWSDKKLDITEKVIDLYNKAAK